MRQTTTTLSVAVLALALAGCPTEPEVPDDVFGAMGEIAPYADAEQRATFERGLEVMARQWTIEEGLGPHFNLSSCGGCHERPTPGGSAPRYRNFLLIQDRLPDGTQPATGVEGIQPQFHVTDSRHASPDNVEVQALRNSIPFFGVGLLAQIPGEAIEANADPDDADGDGISGRPNYDQGFVGRFGRKSQTVSIEGFIRGPLFNHLGITTDPLSAELQAALPVPSVAGEDVGGAREGLGADVGVVRMHQAAAPSSPITDEDGVPDPEMTEQELFDLVSAAMLLAAPRPDEPTEETEAGEALFGEVGCGDCHVRGLVSPRGLIPLYSDLLLHDMGPALADGVKMGVAEGSEFRTQPLWGVAAVGPYLHDGRADTLDEAIRHHGGEAERARDAYEALTDEERGRIVGFLESLGGRSQRTPGLLPPDAPVPAAGTYGGPRADMAAADMPRFERGRAIFDADIPLSDGLGPSFNGDSCRACHFSPVIGGAGPIDLDVTRQAISLSDGTVMAPPMGTMAHRHDVGAQRPPVDPNCDVFELRQTPPLFGLGLIDAIPDAEILSHEDPDDLDGDGISGRAHVLTDGRIGRLGWKADVPSLAEFTRDGMTNEQGITLPDQAGLTFGRATDEDDVPDPEITVEDLEALTFFMAQLAPPPRTRADRSLEDAGEALFESVGCTGCHMTLSLEDGTPVPLYSDLLLHDVFEADFLGAPSGDASHREMRTAPLWGLAESGPYMHDGRSATIEDAIARHFGEASAAAEAFGSLSAEDRAAMLAFLRSL